MNNPPLISLNRERQATHARHDEHGTQVPEPTTPPTMATATNSRRATEEGARKVRQGALPDPIQIKPGEAGRLIVHLPYSRERVAKIKTVDSRRWHAKEKYWSVPHNDVIFHQLLTLFAGEAVEVEPSLDHGRIRILEHGEPTHQPVAPTSKLLEQVRVAARVRHLSHNTVQAYSNWIKRFMSFHGTRPVAEMGEPEIGRFLSSLACECHVSASTQNQALNALLFLYHEVLAKKIGLVQGVVRAKRSKRLPVVLTKGEVSHVMISLQGTPWLMVMLLYGAGLRLMECCRLRVKDIEISRNQIVVRGGKGDKDRYTTLPMVVKEPLVHHLKTVKQQHDQDLRRGRGRVALPNALERKYPHADKD